MATSIEEIKEFLDVILMGSDPIDRLPYAPAGILIIPDRQYRLKLSRSLPRPDPRKSTIATGSWRATCGLITV